MKKNILNSMKVTVILLPLVLLGLFLAINSGCDTDPLETCEQDEICTGKTVTACCTLDDCYYEYNGEKYTDVAELAAALGCTNASMPDYQNEMASLMSRLTILSETARAKMQ